MDIRWLLVASSLIALATVIQIIITFGVRRRLVLVAARLRGEIRKSLACLNPEFKEQVSIACRMRPVWHLGGEHGLWSDTIILRVRIEDRRLESLLGDIKERVEMRILVFLKENGGSYTVTVN